MLIKPEKRIPRKLPAFAVALASLLLGASTAYAACFGAFLNPVTEVCWHCILPIKIGGQVIVPGIEADTVDLSSSPVCVCPTPVGPRPGITFSFWEPARFIEVVKTPFCFPSIGVGMTNPAGGMLVGGSEAETSNALKDTKRIGSFAQAHYFLFPVWAMMEVAVNAACVESGSIDVAYITEVDPFWQDDLFTAILQPEAILFANPIAQMSCAADSALSLIGGPLLDGSSILFWCMGSWGSAYPLTGHLQNRNWVESSAGIAARLLYKLNRELVVWDYAIALCNPVPTPIWVKQNYKLQIAKPVRDALCHPIGRTGLVWDYAKNPPFRALGNKSDEFLWMVFRKRACCAM